MAAVRDHQRSRLRSVLVRPEGDWDRDRLHTMQRELIMRHELDELPLQPALRLLELIDYVTRDACFPHFEDTEVWRTAIGLCSDLYILGDVSGAEQIPIETLRPREVNVGRAALFLRERGATGVDPGSPGSTQRRRLKAHRRRNPGCDRKVGWFPVRERGVFHARLRHNPEAISPRTTDVDHHRVTGRRRFLSDTCCTWPSARPRTQESTESPNKTHRLFLEKCSHSVVRLSQRTT